jgi:hypothetical protein
MYINIHNSVFLLCCYYCRFYPLYLLVLSTLHIYGNKKKKKRRAVIHNSIRLISVHRGGQHYTRLYSSSPFAYIYVDMYTQLCCSLLLRYHYICPYMEILVALPPIEKPQIFPNILSCIS